MCATARRRSELAHPWRRWRRWLRFYRYRLHNDWFRPEEPGYADKMLGGGQRRTHLTPHTSHLTPHTSHLTPHTSHLTPHTSHLTPHTSHLTPHRWRPATHLHFHILAAAVTRRLHVVPTPRSAWGGVRSCCGQRHHVVSFPLLPLFIISFSPRFSYILHLNPNLSNLQAQHDQRHRRGRSCASRWPASD